MPDKIIYVHPTLPSTADITVVRPKDLDALLENGWEIVSSSPKKISGKSVDRYHLRTAADNRGVTVRGDYSPRQRDPEDIPEHRGVAIMREPGTALSTRNASFLGDGSDFAGLPGVQFASSTVVQHAFGMGTDAAHRPGSTEKDCPWPAGTVGATQWLRGFQAAQRSMTTGGDPTSGATAEAYAMGKEAGGRPEDIEVHCPYPPGTPHYDEWLRGFKEAGGTVEER